MLEENIKFPMLPKSIRQPPMLPPGGVIGVVAPASPFDRRVFESGRAVLEGMGFQVRPGRGIFERQGYLAGSDRHRANELLAAWLDEGLDALICARGGYGSMRILPYLDFALLAKRAIPFIGFSDISAILQQLVFRMGLSAFHGPTVCSLADADEATRDSFLRMLTGGAEAATLAAGLHPLISGRASGVLVGGNLTTLCHLLGTPYAAGYRGCVLFIEDRGEAPYRIDRMLAQMKLAGCFEGLAGLVLGSFQDCGTDADINAIVSDVFGDLPIPVVAGLAAGHTQSNMTLPLGRPVLLDAEKGELVVTATDTEGRCDTVDI